MEPAPIQIFSRAAFDLMMLSAGRHRVVSIREEEANPIPRQRIIAWSMAACSVTVAIKCLGGSGNG